MKGVTLDVAGRCKNKSLAFVKLIITRFAFCFVDVFSDHPALPRYALLRTIFLNSGGRKLLIELSTFWKKLFFIRIYIMNIPFDSCR